MSSCVDLEETNIAFGISVVPQALCLPVRPTIFKTPLRLSLNGSLQIQLLGSAQKSNSQIFELRVLVEAPVCLRYSVISFAHADRLFAVARSVIDKDEELFAVPRSLVLDVKNSNLHEHIRESLQDFGPWLSLTTVIIHEYMRQETSKWYPYFRVLPTTFDTLMFWSVEELAELQGSAVLEKIGKAAAEAEWKTTIIPFMRKYPDLFPVADADAESHLVSLAHMAASLIMAYAFDLETDDEKGEEGGEVGLAEEDEEVSEKGMVPFADMLNANADKNNVCRLSDPRISLSSDGLLGPPLLRRRFSCHESHKNYSGGRRDIQRLRTTPSV